MKKAVTFLALCIMGMYLWVANYPTQFKQVGTHFFKENSDFENPAEIAVIDDKLFVAGKTHLQRFGSKGEVEWEKPLASFYSQMSVSKSILTIAEVNKGELYVLDHNGEVLHSSEGHGQISHIKAFDDGSVCAIAGRTILIYSSSAEEIYKISMPPGEIVDYLYSDADKKVVTLTLDSKLNTYISQLTASGENTAGKIISEGLAYQMWVEQDQIVVFTDQSLIYLDKDLTILETKKTGNNYGVCSEDHMICAKMDGEVQLLDSGEKLMSLQYPVKRAYRIDGGFLTLSDSAQIIDGKGSFVQTFPTSGTLLDIKRLSDRKFLMVFTNRVEFYAK